MKKPITLILFFLVNIIIFSQEKHCNNVLFVTYYKWNNQKSNFDEAFRGKSNLNFCMDSKHIELNDKKLTYVYLDKSIRKDNSKNGSTTYWLGHDKDGYQYTIVFFVLDIPDPAYRFVVGITNMDKKEYSTYHINPN